MHASIVSKLRGFAVIEVQGDRCESFVNEAGKMGFVIWNIRRTSPDRLQLCIILRDYFRLRPVLKQTGCRVRVLERHGVPFFLDRLLKRKFFIAGAGLFMAVLILLSSIIWEVDVVGNETIPEERILAAAKAEGLHPLQWSFRLKTPDELSRRMLNRLPELSWIGFDRSGTKVTIKVVEAAKPQEKEGQSPRNLISTSDAVITEIIAERGKPAVRKNMRVKKGDVLISGWIGSEENRQAVVSEGTVRGLVWHEYDIVSPLVRQYKVYTGESKNLRYLVVGKHALKLTGYGKRKFDRYETISDQLWLHWRDYKIPLGWLKEKEMEVAVERQTIGKEEAAAAGLERAKADIWSRYGRDAVIREQKILHEKTENGKVYMKVLFEVEQNIAQEQPIVHIQGE